LRGQRGTGKELFASFIHRYGTNPSGPFEIVDSGALSPQLYAPERIPIEWDVWQRLGGGIFSSMRLRICP
jgi:hypothetical protein